VLKLELELELERIQDTNPYDTKAIAVDRSGCACGAQKVIVGPVAELSSKQGLVAGW
jgi:hypothetical protein